VEETLSALSDLIRTAKVRAIGTSTFPASGNRRGAVGRRAARTRASDRAATVLDPHPEHRTRDAAGLPALRDRHTGLPPAGPRPVDRPLPQGPGVGSAIIAPRSAEQLDRLLAGADVSSVGSGPPTGRELRRMSPDPPALNGSDEAIAVSPARMTRASRPPP
jgi:hypothetical protein